MLSAVTIFLADFAVQKAHCPRRSLNLPSWPTRSRRGDHSVRSRAPPADSASRLGARLYARKIVTATSTLSLCANKLKTVKTHRFVKFCVYPSGGRGRPLLKYYSTANSRTRRIKSRRLAASSNSRLWAWVNIWFSSFTMRALKASGDK